MNSERSWFTLLGRDAPILHPAIKSANIKRRKTMTMTNSMNNSKSKALKARPNRAQGNNKPTALSAAAMGRALVLLASSCAAFRTGCNSIAPAARSRSRTASSSPLMNDNRVGTALNYLNGAANQSIDMQTTNTNAVSQTLLGNGSGSSWMTPTRGWLAASNVDDEQAAMDEYLLYIQKRYNRLHEAPTSTSTAGSAATSSVVTPSSSSSSVPISSRRSTSNTSSVASSSISTMMTPISSHKKSSSVSSSPSRIQSLGTILKIATTFMSSLRIIRNFFSFKLLENGGMMPTVLSLAMLVMVRPFLKGVVSSQG